MKFLFPTKRYDNKACEFIKEFTEFGSEINGSEGLDTFLQESSYDLWLEKVMTDIDIANIKKPRVPALTYFYVREEDDVIVGMVNIRLALNDFLFREGGHIGYCIRPTERQKHYATNMLREALKVCNTIGIKEVIVTCDQTNIASANVIRNCGGTLESEFYSDTFEENIQRYIIRLD